MRFTPFGWLLFAFGAVSAVLSCVAIAYGADKLTVNAFLTNCAIGYSGAALFQRPR